MKEYQYAVRSGSSMDLDAFQEKLNRAGEAGFRVVAFTTVHIPPSSIGVEAGTVMVDHIAVMERAVGED